MKTSKKRPGGRPNKFKREYIQQARKLCQFGHTDPELAKFFEVHLQTINNWKRKYPEFLYALKTGKEVADSRVERSLYARAVGYNLRPSRSSCQQTDRSRSTPNTSSTCLLT
jgi:hypothetical protein